MKNFEVVIRNKGKPILINKLKLIIYENNSKYIAMEPITINEWDVNQMLSNNEIISREYSSSDLANIFSFRFEFTYDKDSYETSKPHIIKNK